MKKDGTVESLTVYIINYFGNDYLIIKDFLTSKSPWDNQMCYILKITPLELEKTKSKILSSMFYKYAYDIITPLSMSDNTDAYCLPDLLVTEKIQTIKFDLTKDNKLNNDELTEKLANLIKTDNYTFIQMLKYNIEVLKEQDYEINEDSHNKFIWDIQNIYDLYEKLYSQLGSEIEKFYDVLGNEFKKYLYHNFRNRNELIQFIKYLISVVYAYIKYEEINKLDIIDAEYDLIEVIEHNDKVDELFFSEENFMLDILEVAHSMYFDLGLYFDTRDKVDNKDNIFNTLDDSYGVSKNQIVIIEGVFTESNLEDILQSFEKDNFTIDNVFDTLIKSNQSIYNRLYEHDLDPRLEEHYKKQLVKQIIVGVYEYEFYLSVIKKEQVKHYEEIKLLNFSDYQELLNYFINNYLSLIERYYEYKHDTNYVHERTLLEIVRLNELKNIDAMNRYAVSRYMPVLTNRLVQLQSVDFMNMCIHAIANGYHEYSESDKVNMLNSMCLNIYENIIIGKIEGLIVDQIKSFLDSNDNPAETLLCNEKLLKQFETIFLRLNYTDISYSSESRLRSKINTNEKTLKKLNPFDE